jgi:hypothetical protein
MASWVRDLHGKVEASMVEYVGDACDLVDTNLNFEALLHKHSCWASDVALHRFLELLREALIQSPNATCFYGTAGAENGLLVDVFETIQQTQSKEFPQVEDDFQNDVEKNVTHYFCLPFLQSFFDVAQSTGEWAPLIADFTLYTKSLTQCDARECAQVAATPPLRDIEPRGGPQTVPRRRKIPVSQSTRAGIYLTASSSTGQWRNSTG